jgi:hypothetical protein
MQRINGFKKKCKLGVIAGNRRNGDYRVRIDQVGKVGYKVCNKETLEDRK